MTGREAVGRIFRGMREDVRDYLRLRELLQAQFEAALHHRAQESRQIAEQISQLTAVLESRRSERVELAKQLLVGRSPRVSIEAVAERLPASSRAPFNECWQRLEALVSECKQLNQRNCRLIMDQYDIMRRVLGAEALTYAPG